MAIKKDLVLPADVIAHLRLLFQSCRATNHLRRLEDKNIPLEEAALLLEIGSVVQDVRWSSSGTAKMVAKELWERLPHPFKDRAGAILSAMIAKRDAGWECSRDRQLLLALTLATYFLMIPPTIPAAQEHATTFAETLPRSLWDDFESFLHVIIGFVEEERPRFDPVWLPKEGHEGAPPVVPVSWTKPN